MYWDMGVETLKLDACSPRQGRGTSGPVTPYGRLSKVHASNAPPDPGASNSCLHRFPDKRNAGPTVIL